MASALRKIWLEPEEQAAPLRVRSRPQPRHRQQTAPSPQRTLLLSLKALGVIIVLVGMAIVYTNANARIAQCSFQRQSLQQEYTQLTRDCAQLKLEVDHLAAQPRISQVAQARGLDMPDAERQHCVRVTSDPQMSLLTRTNPTPPQRSWMAQSRRQLTAALDSAFQRLSRGPGAPAYAQD